VSMDGTFTIPGVPAGLYYLHYGSTFVFTSERTMDLGSRYCGRPAAVVPAQPTPLVLSATGLSPWSDGEITELFSLGAGTWGDVFTAVDPAQVPLIGATDLTGVSIDMQKLRSNKLIDGAKGDVAVFTQLVAQAAAVGAYVSLGNSFSPPMFSQVDGQPQ